MSKMITLSPIKKLYSNCGLSTLIDDTDYDQSSEPGFTIEKFIGVQANPFNGVRIIRVESPSGDVELFSFADNIATNSFVTEFLPVTELSTEITNANNQKFQFTIRTLETGTYNVWILSIPYSTQQSLDYDTGDISMFPNAPDRVIYLYNGVGFAPLFTDVNFSGIPENYINKTTLEIDCSVVDNWNCIFSNYQSSFCGSCGCGDICKNKKSNNILKASLLLSELKIVSSDPFVLNEKILQYSKILKILCQCS